MLLCTSRACRGCDAVINIFGTSAQQEGSVKAALSELLCRCKGLYQTKVLAGEATGQADDIHLEVEQLSCSPCIHFFLQAASSTANRSVAGYSAWAQAAHMLNVCVGPSLVKEKLLKTKMVYHGGMAPYLSFSVFLSVSEEALVSSAGLSGSCVPWRPRESPWLAPLWAAHGRCSNI